MNVTYYQAQSEVFMSSVLWIKNWVTYLSYCHPATFARGSLTADTVCWTRTSYYNNFGYKYLYLFMYYTIWKQEWIIVLNFFTFLHNIYFISLIYKYFRPRSNYYNTIWTSLYHTVGLRLPMPKTGTRGIGVRDKINHFTSV